MKKVAERPYAQRLADEIGRQVDRVLEERSRLLAARRELTRKRPGRPRTK